MKRHPNYKGDMDDRMWGANRLPGRILGGMPIQVTHELLAHFVPEYGKALTIYSMPNVFKNRQDPLIFAVFRRVGSGTNETIELDRSAVEAWLDEHYLKGYRLGMVYGLSGTNNPAKKL